MKKFQSKKQSEAICFVLKYVISPTREAFPSSAELDTMLRAHSSVNKNDFTDIWEQYLGRLAPIIAIYLNTKDMGRKSLCMQKCSTLLIIKLSF